MTVIVLSSFSETCPPSPPPTCQGLIDINTARLDNFIHTKYLKNTRIKLFVSVNCLIYGNLILFLTPNHLPKKRRPFIQQIELKEAFNIVQKQFFIWHKKAEQRKEEDETTQQEERRRGEKTVVVQATSQLCSFGGKKGERERESERVHLDLRSSKILLNVQINFQAHVCLMLPWSE